MANRSSTSAFQLIEKLAGRENYRRWAIIMRAYLEIEDLWDTVEAPVNGQISTDLKKLAKARGRMILSVEPEVLTYVENAQTPKEVWDELSKTYDDKGLARKVNLLQEATTTKLENCRSMENYVSRIISATRKLMDIGTNLPDDLVGALLLAGLPSSYKPMIMALSNSGTRITGDLIKNKLLEEAETVTNQTSEFESRGLSAQAHAAQFQSYNGTRSGRGHSKKVRGTRRNAGIRCYNCNRFGHYATKCTAPRRGDANTCMTAANDESDCEDSVCALLVSQPATHTHTGGLNKMAVNSVSATKTDDALFAVGLLSASDWREWILDSGASTHMCCRGDQLTNIRSPTIKNVTAANKAKIPVRAEGDICIQNSGSVGRKKILLQNVLHVPDLTANLVSVSAIAKQGGEVIFRGSKCQIRDRGGSVVLEGNLSHNNIYNLNLQSDSPQCIKVSDSVALRTVQSTDITLWHRRMAHLNSKYLKQLRQVAVGVNFDENQFNKCEICVAGKLINKPFKASSNRASEILQLVHSDVCQVEDLSLNEAKYFITLLDDYSRKLFVYFLRRKDEVPDVLLKFIAFAEKQTGRKLKVLRTDNGREYVNTKLKSALEQMGVKHETSMAYHPQQNGRAERVNRTILEKTRCMLTESKLPNKFWAEAVSTACYLSNRSPNRCLGGKTPEEMWSGKKPDLTSIRVFGSRARAYVPGHLRKKIEPTSKPAIMLGYCENQKGYRLWSNEEQRVFTASNVEFFEEVEPTRSRPNQVLLPADHQESPNSNSDDESTGPVAEAEKIINRKEPAKKATKRRLPVNKGVNQEEPVNKILKKNLPGVTGTVDENVSSSSNTLGPTTRSMSNVEQNVHDSSEDEVTQDPARRTQRRRKTPRHLDEFVTYSVVTSMDEPKDYGEAITCPESEQWKRAMQEEYSAITKNDTWHLCSLPSRQSVVGCKWIFKKKRLPNGSTRYKARLVALGFLQQKGVNFDETYSPVVRFTSLRLLFAYAARRNLDIYHLDIETAFLHGEMTETVYLQQPQGFVIEGHEEKVCLLHKAMYGLKQGSRNWNLKLDNALKHLGLAQSSFDSCVYSYYSPTKLIIIALFVDDLIIFSDSIDYFNKVKEGLDKICTVKNLGPLQRCLGINVHRDRVKGTIELEQSDYITSLLARFGMADCRSVGSPLELNSASSRRTSPQTNFNPSSIPYQAAVGSLLYLVQATRPDLAYAVSVLSRFNNNYDDSHWGMVKRVLRYVQGTRNFRLRYTHDDGQLIGYCDASHAADPEDRRSVSGYIFTMQGGAVSWNSRRQSTVALSSTEAEYLALSAAAQEALWLRRLAIELRIMNAEEPLLIYCDNKGAIDLSKNSRFSARTKHIDVRHQFIKENIRSKEIKVEFVPSSHMLADTLTKATGPAKLIGFVEGVGIKKEEQEQ